MTRRHRDLSRREAIALLGAAALTPLVRSARRGFAPDSSGPGFRIRTITVGTNLRSPSDTAPVEAALASLKRAQRVLTDAGYEVQTIRIATQPFLEEAGRGARANAVAALQALDRAVVTEHALLSIGPALAPDGDDPEFPAWAADHRQDGCLPGRDESGFISMNPRSSSRRVAPLRTRLRAAASDAILDAAEAVAAERGLEGASIAAIAERAGVAAVGLESPPLLSAAFAGANTLAEAKQRLTAVLESRLGPLERLVRQVARRDEREYLGIDVSPAPGKDASIGAAVEALTGVPFGSASTLAGCAAITDVLKSLRVKTCGYSGLMLPVLEDPVLARRASEGRFSVRELLLYSSVCGTGLDVVPLPGDTPADQLAALIADVAALSTKLRKPLSARLFLVPGKAAGEMAHFDDPYLTDCVVMKAE